jgi:hypothetical protein
VVAVAVFIAQTVLKPVVAPAEEHVVVLPEDVLETV